MFKELWKEVPTAVKVLWIGSLTLSVGLTGFAVWAVYRIVMHLTAG
jgi:hypothetical protein